MDSGLGGLPYGYFFHLNNKNEHLICVADRANFPYGVKSSEAIIGILDSLTEKLISLYNPKLLALVCNTATVTGLDFLRKKYTFLPIVGTVPAIKPAVLESKTRRVGVLASERAIEDPCIRELADYYGPDCEIIGIAAPELIEFAQQRLWAATADERFDAVNHYIKKFRSSGVDSIVLGCTHFLHLADDFRLAAGEDIGIYDSVEGVSRRVESILDGEDGKLRSGFSLSDCVPVLSVTGDAPLEPYWEKYSQSYGFTLETNS